MDTRSDPSSAIESKDDSSESQSYGAIAKRKLYYDYFVVLLAHLDSKPEWLFLKRERLNKAIQSIMDSPDDSFVNVALPLFSAMLFNQKVVVELISGTPQSIKRLDEVIAGFNNPTTKYNKSWKWIDSTKLIETNVATLDKTEMRNFNDELFQLIDNCFKLYAPTHLAGTALHDIKLTSYPEIQQHAKDLHSIINKEYIIYQSLRILNKPAPQAIVALNKLYLNLDFAIQILFKLLNQKSRNLLSGDREFAAQFRLVKQIVKLEFKTEEDSSAYETVVHFETIIEKDLFESVFNEEELTADLKQIALANNVLSIRHKAMVTYAKEFVKSQKAIRQMLYILEKNIDLTACKADYTATRMDYLTQLIKDTSILFNYELLLKDITTFRAANNDMQQIFVKVLEGSLKKLVVLITNITVENQITSPALNYFGLDLEDGIFVQKDTPELDLNVTKYIDLASLCVFFNTVKPRDQQSIWMVKQKLVTLFYLVNCLNYCAYYDKINKAFADHQSILKADILRQFAPIQSIKTSAAKISVMPAKEQKETIKSEQELQIEKLQANTKKFAKKQTQLKQEYVDFKTAIAVAREIPACVPADMLVELKKKMAEFAEFELAMGKTLTSFENTSYSEENLAAITATQASLSITSNNLKTLTASVSQIERDEFAALTCMHNKLIQGYREFNDKLIEAQHKLRGLNAHATSWRKGKTDKPPFHDFERTLQELEKSAKLYESSEKNLSSATKAYEKLQGLQTRLTTLLNNLQSTKNYFESQRIFRRDSNNVEPQITSREVLTRRL